MAWAKPKEATVKDERVTPSLTEIMDEELARKMQAEENGPEAESKDAEAEAAVTPEEPDHLVTDEELARMLQEQEDGLAAAARLQSKFAKEAHLRMPKRNTASMAKAAFDEGDDGSYEEDTVVGAAAERHRQREPQQSHRGGKSKSQSPQSLAATSAVTTKHDAEMSGRRNAEQLAELVDGDFGSDSRGVDLRIPNKTYNAVREHNRRREMNTARMKEASTDQSRTGMVMDDATRVALLGLLNSDVIAELGGAVSTGKEATVYHSIRGSAARADGEKLVSDDGVTEFALKVFKTMNEFRNRDVYIDGEFLKQFERAKLHPAKAIRLWAQKELRNLGRCHRNGLRCPEPVGLYGHNVLVMEFVGKEGRPAPMLRDAPLRSGEEWTAAYTEVAAMMRAMFQRCKLVHADLSEYNILFLDGRPWFIDMAQAVPHDHSNAITFLRRDCATITTFFRRRGVATLTMRELFEWVVDPIIQAEEETARLAALVDRAARRGADVPLELRQEEDVFVKCTVARDLSDISEPTEFDALVRENDPTCLSQLTMAGLRHEETSDIEDEATDQ